MHRLTSRASTRHRMPPAPFCRRSATSALLPLRRRPGRSGARSWQGTTSPLPSRIPRPAPKPTPQPRFVSPPPSGRRFSELVCRSLSARSSAQVGLEPGVPLLRRHFVEHTVAGGPSVQTGSVQVARRVADYTCFGIGAFGSAEAVEHRLLAGGSQLVHHAACEGAPWARGSSEGGGSVEVTGLIANHAIGCAPIGTARERVQHGVIAGGVQLKDNSLALIAVGQLAVVVRRPVEIAGRIADHTRE